VMLKQRILSTHTEKQNLIQAQGVNKSKREGQSAQVVAHAHRRRSMKEEYSLRLVQILSSV